MKLFISVIITLFLLTVCVDVASAQTLVNGANQTGTVLFNTTNSYTFSANTGDNINLRVGTTNFSGWLRLFGPDGRLLVTGTDEGNTDVYIDNYTATNSGTFTVLLSSWFSGQSGTYALHLAQIPEAFIVPAGDEGGPLTNGADATGAITLGDSDMWSFTANKGDNINLRVGTTGFGGWLQLFGPDGRLLVTGADSGNTDTYIDNYTATNSGTFTVLVSSWYSQQIGTYALHLAQIPEAFIVPAGDEGGPLTNGADATGAITLGDSDMWSFTANKGDNINLRVGTTGFGGWLQLFGPDGRLLVTGADSGNTDTYIDNYTATNSGTFTVLVSSWYSQQIGTYALHLAQIPEAFIVPAGDEGGPLTNGADATGAITLGDSDMWSFTANKGDNINLRVGTTGFGGWLQLFGPDGRLLVTGADSGNTDTYIDNYTATNSGTFTVLVSSWYSQQIGTYALHLAQIPEAFIVPAGDEGGPLTNGADATGAITLGDSDMWSFTACTGDSINLQLNTTNFNGWLQLFGSTGGLLKTTGGSTVSSIAYTATNCGTFTVLVSSWYSESTGTYGLTANELEDTMKVCFPVISGASLTVNGVGGPTNANFILYSATNIATPFGLWTPVLTNQFNQFGVFSYTNGYNPALGHEYFRFVLP